MVTSRYKRHFSYGLSAFLAIGACVVIVIMMVILFFGYQGLIQQSINMIMTDIIFVTYMILFVYCFRQHFIYQTFRSLLYMLIFLLLALAMSFINMLSRWKEDYIAVVLTH